MSRPLSTVRLIVFALAVLLLVAACNGGDAATEDNGETAEGGAVTDGIDLSGVDITAGSKEFSSQQIMGQMTVLALEAAGANVADETGLQGTDVVRNGLESGDIDVYWEYTGTGWITILQNDEILEDSQAYYEEVRDADAENGIVWLEPSEVDDTYAFFTNPANVDLDVSTISELAELAESDPDQVTLCAATEFITRPDGLPGIEETYGFEFSDVEIGRASCGKGAKMGVWGERHIAIRTEDSRTD